MGDMQVAVSPEFKGVIRLSNSGAFIFAMLAQDTDEDKILDALCERYDAPREVLEADMKALITRLREASLLDE